MKKLATILTAGKFDNFEELADIAVGWNADFHQLSAEESESEIFQAAFRSLLISDAYFGCHVEQRGSTPVGMRTFAILEPSSPPMLWYKHVVGPDNLLVFPTHQEISVQSRPGFNVHTCSVPIAVLEDFFAQVGNLELGKILPEREIVLHPPATVLDKIRILMRQASEIVKRSAELNCQTSLVNLFENELLFAFLGALNAEQDRSYLFQRPPNRTIGHLLEYIDSNIRQPLAIADLCRLANVSERTLRNYFERELGMTPKAYLVGKRLAGVHHELWQSKPTKALVSDVANEWGFWHMGQFAADYKKVFGELPSETLKRNSLKSEKK